MTVKQALARLRETAEAAISKKLRSSGTVSTTRVFMIAVIVAV